MHSGHFTAGVLECCVCLSQPHIPCLQQGSGARQEGVKSSLFEALGWGRALASHQRPPQFNFLTVRIEAPVTQSSCAHRQAGQTCRLTKGAKPTMSCSSTRA